MRVQVGLLETNQPLKMLEGWIWSGWIYISVRTILFKIITRMKLLFSKYLGDYSYSFQGSSELISITVTVSFLAEWSYRK